MYALEEVSVHTEVVSEFEGPRALSSPLLSLSSLYRGDPRDRGEDSCGSTHPVLPSSCDVPCLRRLIPV